MICPRCGSFRLLQNRSSPRGVSCEKCSTYLGGHKYYCTECGSYFRTEEIDLLDKKEPKGDQWKAFYWVPPESADLPKLRNASIVGERFLNHMSVLGARGSVQLTATKSMMASKYN